MKYHVLPKYYHGRIPQDNTEGILKKLIKGLQLCQ